MITVTIFRSVVDDTKETKRLENPIKIKDVFPEDDLSNSIISVNGFLQDGEYELADGDICAIRVFPEGKGADWIAGAGLGLLIGFTVLNFWNPGGWATAAILAGSLAAGALGFGIASAAGWSVTGWLGSLGVNAQDVKSPDALEGIPQLRGAKNQSNYGKPVPLVLGRHLFTPMYVGNPYSTIGGEDGEDQYFQALYMLGYGKLKVTDIKLGVIGDLAANTGSGAKDDGNLTVNGDPFLLNSNPELDLIQTARESTLYPQAVVEEQLSIELSHVKNDSVNPIPIEQRRLMVVRFSAKNPMKIQVEITLPGGLVEYDKNTGDKKNASVSISARWQVSRPNDSGSSRWQPFGQFGVGQKNITYSSPATTITRAKAKTMRFIAEKEFTNYSQVSDSYDTRVIELEIYRTNEQSDTPQKTDKVYLTAIRTWLFDNEKSKGGTLVPQVPVIPKLRDRTARLGFRIKATQNTQGMLDALNCIVESRCRTWNSATKKWSASDWDIENQRFAANTETPSNNPAAVALKLLQSPSLGRKAYKDSSIDMESFGEFYEWCAERKYTCNGVLTASKRLDEVFALVLSTGRAMRILNGSKYGLLIDKPREYPVMVLNSQNVLEASNQKGFDDAPDGFLARYVNEDDGYQYTEEYVMADGKSPESQPEAVIETLELPYITNREQAVRTAWYQLACRYLRPEIWNRKLSVDGYLIGIGDMVEIQDDTIAVGLGEGGVIQSLDIENNAITKIYTDGNFEVADMTKTYGLKIMQADGINPIKIRTIPINDILAPGLYNNFSTHIPLTDPVVPHEGDIVAFGEYSKITTPAICFGKKPNGDGTFDCVFIPYQEGIYTTDGGAIPPYEANVTTPQTLPPLHEIPRDQLTIDDVIELSPEQTVIFDLLPSANAVVRSAAGVPTPNSVSCTVIKITGTSVTADDRSKTIKYITSALNDTEHLYSYGGVVPIPAAQTGGLIWIEFRLYDENTIIGKQRVPIVQDGNDTPMYLGKTYDAGSGSGIVGIRDSASATPRQVQARTDDCVAFVGTSLSGSSPWKNGFLIKWTGNGWEQMDPLKTENAALYTAAMKDFLESGSENAFLFAFIGKLFAKHIIMADPGIIESEGFQGADGYVNGYRLTAANGLLEAIGAKFKNINAENMTVSGNLNANTSMFGKEALPLVGAVRGYVEFNYANGSIDIINKDHNISSVARISTGKYIMWIAPYDYPYDMLKVMPVLGYACDAEFSNGYNVIKEWGGYLTNINTGYISASIRIDIRTPSGSLVDPYYASILLVG